MCSISIFLESNRSNVENNIERLTRLINENTDRIIVINDGSNSSYSIKDLQLIDSSLNRESISIYSYYNNDLSKIIEILNDIAINDIEVSKDVCKNNEYHVSIHICLN